MEWTCGNWSIAQLADVPTAKELGYPDLEAKVWWGFAVPKSTPSEVVLALNKYINTALKDPGVQRKLQQMAIVIGGGTVVQFNAFYNEQVQKWERVVKEAHIQVN